MRAATLSAKRRRSLCMLTMVPERLPIFTPCGSSIELAV
jgi:hypothetical protein